MNSRKWIAITLCWTLLSPAEIFAQEEARIDPRTEQIMEDIVRFHVHYIRSGPISKKLSEYSTGLLDGWATPLDYSNAIQHMRPQAVWLQGTLEQAYQLRNRMVQYLNQTCLRSTPRTQCHPGQLCGVDLPASAPPGPGHDGSPSP